MPDYSKMTNVTIHIIDALTAKKKSPSKTPLSVSAQKNIPFPPSHKMETTSSSVDFHARNSFHANKRSFIYRESTRFSWFGLKDQVMVYECKRIDITPWAWTLWPPGNWPVSQDNTLESIQRLERHGGMWLFVRSPASPPKIARVAARSGKQNLPAFFFKPFALDLFRRFVQQFIQGWWSGCAFAFSREAGIGMRIGTVPSAFDEAGKCGQGNFDVLFQQPALDYFQGWSLFEPFFQDCFLVWNEAALIWRGTFFCWHNVLLIVGRKSITGNARNQAGGANVNIVVRWICFFLLLIGKNARKRAEKLPGAQKEAICLSLFASFCAAGRWPIEDRGIAFYFWFIFDS